MWLSYIHAFNWKKLKLNFKKSNIKCTRHMKKIKLFMKDIKENMIKYKNEQWSWKRRFHIVYYFTNGIRTSQQCTSNLSTFVLLFHILYNQCVVIILALNIQLSLKEICLNVIYIYVSIYFFWCSSFLCFDPDLHLLSFYFCRKGFLKHFL